MPDARYVMCGDRVLAGQWSGVVAAQHGPFSWVVIDGINVPQTHADDLTAECAAARAAIRRDFNEARRRAQAWELGEWS